MAGSTKTAKGKDPEVGRRAVFHMMRDSFTGEMSFEGKAE